MSRAARKYGVPLAILYAVGLTETGNRGRLNPNALNVNGDAVYLLDKPGAIRQFQRALAAGIKSIDAGCMQINYLFHGDRFGSIDAMLDPALNVDYAARFLSELKAREGSWTMAIARYNAGPANTAAHRKYRCRVIENLVATGFGGWTASARAYCQP